MHKVAMEMGKWAMEKAKTHGFDNLSAQDWDDLKDCMEAVKCAICADKDYRIVEAMVNANRKKSILDAWDMTVTAIQMGVSLQKVGEPEKVIGHICTWKTMTGWTSI